MILVFKTNVKNRRQVQKVQQLLFPLSSVTRWNFDLEDCDRVLRVIANDIPPRYIEELLTTAGIYCRELED
ncbi:hypothetical protein [Hufsiella ginkgonis]|uniref:Uncharacterized protein n=1 Tax=Hufsiella ginkgonis TaxID=2695274 RepID=A0A7K1XXN4_9SPHI|nr:hypothetical protein [Hufsiella ginkgonis]MXV15693.1 hypothetical protein [Hufsiella ginkgonis]